MATRASTHPALTPEISKAARRELGVTQAKVIAETGINAYKLKMFESRGFNLDIQDKRILAEFYTSNGVDLGEVAEYLAATSEPGPGVARQQRASFVISDALPQGLADAVFERLAQIDERVLQLQQQPYVEGIFGVSEATTTNLDELSALMREGYLLFRVLVGGSEFLPSRAKAKSVAENLNLWLEGVSPQIFEILQDVEGREPFPRAAKAARAPYRAATAEIDD